MTSPQKVQPSMIKIVYFDEDSATDYLDIAAGGKAATTTESVKDRATDLHAKVETSLAAKFSWLPFLGASAEVGSGVDFTIASQSILRKTLSNTILTDYLTAVAEDDRIVRLEGVRVTAAKDSMAYMKMFTPYMVIADSRDTGIDLAKMDEALASAKGYYELLGESETTGRCVLRFNIKAFRNNYGLTDLSRMHLVFHGIRVGKTTENALGFRSEMALDIEDRSLSPVEIVDGEGREAGDKLDVFDVVLAGVEHVN